ncbi:hypothetical protein Dimus_033421 [Dionaea muscipula]
MMLFCRTFNWKPAEQTSESVFYFFFPFTWSWEFPAFNMHNRRLFLISFSSELIGDQKIMIWGDLPARFSSSFTLTLIFMAHFSFQWRNTAAAAAGGDGVCEYSVVDGIKQYKYSLASAIPDFPHGVLSEDGFYRVAANNTILWFQLCDGMIFNHDSPRCVDCSDCGGSKHCGMGCHALVATNIGGYFVCDAIGTDSSFDINLLDQKNPHMGVTVKLGTISSKVNCSLSVSVTCLDALKEPKSLEKLGTCDYATVLHHPAGCALIVPVHRKGWGWFGTLLIILFCFLGAYLLSGMVYRFFFLRIRGLDVVPNLAFWTSVPHRTQSFFMSVVHKIRGPTYHHRSSYSPVNF